jgi:pimeloyl-ACP methyl ester carboxylesterase
MLSCLDCINPHGYIFDRPYTCGHCRRYPLCWNCVDFGVITNLAAMVKPTDAVTLSVCYACFQQLCPLDLAKAFEVMNPAEGVAVKLSVVMAHGGGACRASFRAHARELAKDGFRCILLDLPGHGGRVKEPLTLASAIEAVRSVTTLTCGADPASKPVFFGANIGGYVGMEVAGKYPSLFRGVCIVVACQNVGVGASWKATLPLKAFAALSGFLSAERFLRLLLKDIKYSASVGHGLVHLDMVKECSLGCSLYFQQAKAQIALLFATDSLQAMDRFRGDVWYAIAGSDRMEQDMAPALLELAKRRSEAGGKVVRLTSYAGAMRFFTHDTRYYDAFVGDLKTFLNDLQR